MRILSLGAGVQSSTMALMYKHGELPNPPACAIFADTQSEPAAVYKWLDILEGLLPFKVYRVTSGNLRDTLLSEEGRFVGIPSFMVKPGGDEAFGLRQCTQEFKIGPLRRKAKELAGFPALGTLPKGAEPIHMLIGISTDEAAWRFRRSEVKYIVNEHPLLDARMSRYDCLAWMEAHGYPEPPKSACSFCPFHDDVAWRRIKDTDEAAWQDSIRVDAAIRHVRGFESAQFLHEARIPLADVDLSNPKERGQEDLFMTECQGMCGV